MTQVYLAQTTGSDGYTQIWGPYRREFLGATVLKIVKRTDFVPGSEVSRRVPNGAGGHVLGDFVKLRESR